MKRSISTLLTTLLLSAAIAPAMTVYAQETRTGHTSLNPYVIPASQSQPSPFNLAYLAYQGYLKDQGIPSSGALINGLVSGTITAQDLMQAAVKANRLPEQILSDQGYRFALESQLQEFATD